MTRIYGRFCKRLQPENTIYGQNYKSTYYVVPGLSRFMARGVNNKIFQQSRLFFYEVIGVYLFHLIVYNCGYSNIIFNHKLR